ncbi:SDR family oxidoreductase [Pseudomonas stutzeri]|uniref:UDP-glucose 4-epimerase family protein n=1 Tax=Stutzerimonas stutzeri TaxID=316 RepID=UPI002109DED0|nr:SDR family oxidoreductase [Stutzerimonas stutzeri]MCQ4306539.1 SDR family oxidoreductase [Stutzerimonas stutzeri]
MTYKVLVTGATGFVGYAILCKLLETSGVQVLAGVRDVSNNLPAGVVPIYIGDLRYSQRYESLANVSVVVHCAAQTPMLGAHGSGALPDFETVNLEGTLNLARQAAEAGARRFIFLSSIKVNGERTKPGERYTAGDSPAPTDPYGVSKSKAERALSSLALSTGMEVVIIRPPLVYGPNVKGNFASMINLVKQGIPLPLGAIHNKRSLVSIDNLVDLIIRCIDHPAAANQVLLASDGVDLSTTELLRGLGAAMGKPARLIPVPACMLQFGATLLGKKAMAQRLLGSLQVDISKTCELLDWKPPYTVEEGLKRCFERSA